MRVAIKQVQGGKFSGYANEALRPGEVLEVMPPMGKFTLRESDKPAKQYVAFAAGSGITPVMGIMRHVLETEPESETETEPVTEAEPEPEPEPEVEQPSENGDEGDWTYTPMSEWKLDEE